tara:strand:- start:8 stop:268 length:261 start_codon:yes stop_codon:yes gene_type:complete
MYTLNDIPQFKLMDADRVPLSDVERNEMLGQWNLDAERIAEYDNKEYQRQRAAAYPSIADQLDTIYHEGIDAWKATITAVKEEFPK